jgi:hypothetical protein
MFDNDKLVEIPPSEWSELRDIFLLNWPDNLIAWHTVNNYVQWYRKESQIKNLAIYCLNGSKFDGFVVVVSEVFLKCSVVETVIFSRKIPAWSKTPLNLNLKYHF